MPSGILRFFWRVLAPGSVPAQQLGHHVHYAVNGLCEMAYCSHQHVVQ